MHPDIRREQDYFDRALALHERQRPHSPGVDPDADARVLDQLRSRLAVFPQVDAAEGVAFGRIDAEGESFYIGKDAVWNDENEIVVVNWQAPIAAPFYTASAADPEGIDARRAYRCRANRILDIDEEVFTGIARAVAQGRGPVVSDTLLDALGETRSGALRDVVASIQRDQYDVITRDPDQVLVVQGGPGTGKTQVGLHRVSWLLHNHRDRIGPGDVLVVGPNPAFVRYISTVLPALGDQATVQLPITALGPRVRIGRTDPPELRRLKGDRRMLRVIVSGLRNRQRIETRPIDLKVDRRIVRLDGTRVAARARQLSARPHNEAFRELRAFLLAEARAHLAGRASRNGDDREPDVRGEATRAVDDYLAQAWPTLTPQAFLVDLLSSPVQLTAAAAGLLTDDEMALLAIPADVRVGAWQWSAHDVALLDAADVLLNGAPATFEHIVVDEAQDLSPMQLESIRRRSRSGSMTLLGDLAQGTSPWARASWEEVALHLKRDRVPTEIVELSTSYRLPAEVHEVAMRLLPSIAPHLEAPVAVRETGYGVEVTEAADLAEATIEAVHRLLDVGMVGIVVPARHRARVAAALERADLAWTPELRGGSAPIVLLSAEAAKGLEFDGVVVVEPALIMTESERGLRTLFIAMTRCTQRLALVHSDPLPVELGTIDPAPSPRRVTSLLPPEPDEPDEPSPSPYSSYSSPFSSSGASGQSVPSSSVSSSSGASARSLPSSSDRSRSPGGAGAGPTPSRPPTPRSASRVSSSDGPGPGAPASSGLFGSGVGSSGSFGSGAESSEWSDSSASGSFGPDAGSPAGASPARDRSTDGGAGSSGRPVPGDDRSVGVFGRPADELDRGTGVDERPGPNDDPSAGSSGAGVESSDPAAGSSDRSAGWSDRPAGSSDRATESIRPAGSSDRAAESDPAGSSDRAAESSDRSAGSSDLAARWSDRSAGSPDNGGAEDPSSGAGSAGGHRVGASGRSTPADDRRADRSDRVVDDGRPAGAFDQRAEVTGGRTSPFGRTSGPSPTNPEHDDPSSPSRPVNGRIGAGEPAADRPGSSTAARAADGRATSATDEGSPAGSPPTSLRTPADGGPSGRGGFGSNVRAPSGAVPPAARSDRTPPPASSGHRSTTPAAPTARSPAPPPADSAPPDLAARGPVRPPADQTAPAAPDARGPVRPPADQTAPAAPDARGPLGPAADPAAEGQGPAAGMGGAAGWAGSPESAAGTGAEDRRAVFADGTPSPFGEPPGYDPDATMAMPGLDPGDDLPRLPERPTGQSDDLCRLPERPTGQPTAPAASAPPSGAAAALRRSAARSDADHAAPPSDLRRPAAPATPTSSPAAPTSAPAASPAAPAPERREVAPAPRPPAALNGRAATNDPFGGLRHGVQGDPGDRRSSSAPAPGAPIERAEAPPGASERSASSPEIARPAPTAAADRHAADSTPYGGDRLGPRHLAGASYGARPPTSAPRPGDEGPAYSAGPAPDEPAFGAPVRDGRDERPANGAGAAPDEPAYGPPVRDGEERSAFAAGAPSGSPPAGPAPVRPFEPGRTADGRPPTPPPSPRDAGGPAADRPGHGPADDDQPAPPRRRLGGGRLVAAAGAPEAPPIQPVLNGTSGAGPHRPASERFEVSDGDPAGEDRDEVESSQMAVGPTEFGRPDSSPWQEIGGADPPPGGVDWRTSIPREFVARSSPARRPTPGAGPLTGPAPAGPRDGPATSAGRPTLEPPGAVAAGRGPAVDAPGQAAHDPAPDAPGPTPADRGPVPDEPGRARIARPSRPPGGEAGPVAGGSPADGLLDRDAGDHRPGAHMASNVVPRAFVAGRADARRDRDEPPSVEGWTPSDEGLGAGSHQLGRPGGEPAGPVQPAAPVAGTGPADPGGDAGATPPSALPARLNGINGMAGNRRDLAEGGPWNELDREIARAVAATLAAKLTRYVNPNLLPLVADELGRTFGGARDAAPAAPERHGASDTDRFGYDTGH